MMASDWLAEVLHNLVTTSTFSLFSFMIVLSIKTPMRKEEKMSFSERRLLINHGILMSFYVIYTLPNGKFRLIKESNLSVHSIVYNLFH